MYKEGEGNESVVLLFHQSVVAQFAAGFSAQQTVETERNKGDGEELALIEVDGLLHGHFPRFLHLFEKFYQEAEREDARQAPTEEETCARQ